MCIDGIHEKKVIIKKRLEKSFYTKSNKQQRWRKLDEPKHWWAASRRRENEKIFKNRLKHNTYHSGSCRITFGPVAWSIVVPCSVLFSLVLVSLQLAWSPSKCSNVLPVCVRRLFFGSSHSFFFAHFREYLSILLLCVMILGRRGLLLLLLHRTHRYDIYLLFYVFFFLLPRTRKY